MSVKGPGLIPGIVSFKIYVRNLSTATIYPPSIIISVKNHGHISLRMMCTAGLETPQSWYIMAEGQAYLVWPLGKVKCFDTLHPSLEWNVWCRHSIVDKWQIEAARHCIAQWKSIHHVGERSWVNPWYCLFQNLCSKLVNCHHLTTPSYN